MPFAVGTRAEYECFALTFLRILYYDIEFIDHKANKNQFIN
jgi:hypothetical protein